jgi:DNA repair photolyase
MGNSIPQRSVSRRSIPQRSAVAHPAVSPRTQLQRGRGATFNPPSRFDSTATEVFDDGWGVDPDDDAPQWRTRVTAEKSRSIVSTNTSPDIPFDLSINPYKGCEHGCIYCYARPSHAYLGLSPGLDFETRIFSKPKAAALLRAKLSGRNYVPKVIAIGANTDPYQPIERQHRVTRSIIEVMSAYRQPFSIITKGGGILRDLDLLGPLGQVGLCRVMVSITAIDPHLSRIMEPRASHPDKRFAVVRALTDAGVPTGVLAAPMIPAINDAQLEQIIERSAAAGADSVGYIAVRLPLEIKELFEGWLDGHFPDRKERVLSLIRQMRNGELYQARFGERMRGTGPYARLLEARFTRAAKAHGLDGERPALDTSQFQVPPQKGHQMKLF